MISQSVFSQSIAPLRRRWQLRDSIRAGWMTLGAGLGITALLLIAGRFFPLLPSLSLLLIGLSLTAFLLAMGQLWVWLRPLPPGYLARAGDALLGLDERLTTAWELLTGKLDTAPMLRDAQLTDALARLRRADVRRALPLVASPRRMSAVGGVLLALMLSVAALAVLPNPQNAVLQQRRQLDETLDAQITELQQLQTELLAQPDSALATQVEPLTDTLSELIEKLQAARADHSAGEAMAALSAAKESLAQVENARQPAAQSLESVANALAQSDSATAQQMADALKNGDAQQAADALAQAGESAGDPESKSLADALSQAAQAAAASGNSELAQSLQQAASALSQAANGEQSQSVQQALQQAAAQLADAGAQAQAAAQAAQALANIQQAQQALAQQSGAGQGGNQQQAGTGNGQQGNGAGAGANQGSGTGGGNGSGRGEPGAGNDGLYSVNGANGMIPTDNGANQNRLENYDSVFAPAHIGGEGGEFVVPEPQNPGGGVDVGEVPGSPNRDAGSATVPYTEVFRQYSSQANAALENDAIPLGMKDYVRQYFGALEPQ